MSHPHWMVVGCKCRHGNGSEHVHQPNQVLLCVLRSGLAPTLPIMPDNHGPSDDSLTLQLSQ